MIFYGCPKCNEAMSSPDSMAGQRETCPSCGNVVIVPVQSPPATHTPVVNVPSPPATTRHVVNVQLNTAKSTNGLGVAALVIGILAILGCWIPFLNVVSIILAVLGLLFGVIGVIVSLVGRKSGIGFPGAGAFVNIVALIIAVSVNLAAEKALDSVADELSDHGKTAHTDGVKTADKASRKTALIVVEYIGKTKKDYQTEYAFRLTSKCDKDIASLKGGISIYDQFGDRLEGLAVKLDKPLPAGGTVEERGIWMVESRSVELMESGKARLEFSVDEVIYGDGSREKF